MAEFQIMRSNLHRFLLPATSLLAAIGLSSTPAAASGTDFQSRLASEIDRKMVYPHSQRRQEAGGIATVRFEIGSGNRASGIEIVESSGNRALDHAALQTIASLELPADAPAGPHVALLQYGTVASLDQEEAASAFLRSRTQRAQLALAQKSRQQHARSSGGAASVTTLN